jgi:hypothetical protein
LFHNVFADDDTLQAQMDFGVQHLVHRVCNQKLVRLSGRRRTTVQRAVYGAFPAATVKSSELGDEMDLAMCVLHSHAVNAPSKAYKYLGQSIDATSGQHDFVRDLLRRLATSTYGRWNEDVENGRWARTRLRAMKSGLWPERLFKGPDAIMPVKVR